MSLLFETIRQFLGATNRPSHRCGQNVKARRKSPLLRQGIQVLESRQCLTSSVVPNEVLVAFKPSVTTETISSVLRRNVNFLTTETIQTPAMTYFADRPIHIVRSSEGADINSLVSNLRSNPAVEYAEINYHYETQFASNDPEYLQGKAWGVYSDDIPNAGPANTTNENGSQAEKVWNEGNLGDKNVIVGVLDTGISAEHQDLKQNIFVNPKEIANDGKDNDRNGYIDDVSGYDFTQDDPSPGLPSDKHGTHVAGTIGAVGGNGVGVVGVAPDVSLLSLKAGTADEGFYIVDIVRAIDYATQLRLAGHNIVAINMSFGGSNYSRFMHSAIIRAASAGILTVAAAGNNGGNTDSQPFFPASYSTLNAPSGVSPAGYEAVISVAAIADNGLKPFFSNYGKSSVDIAAPGTWILSTTGVSQYEYFNGTSMAAPHVTGVVALYTAKYPDATPSEVRDAILGSARPKPHLVDKVATGGILDAYAALQTPPPVRISIADASIDEGENDTQVLVPITLSAPVNKPVTVNYQTVANTAIPGEDYLTSSGELRFEPGETIQYATITVVGDSRFEGNESFTVTLENASENAVIKTSRSGISIRDNDTPPVASIVPISELENSGVIYVPIRLSQSSGAPVTLHYRTVNGTAKASGRVRRDYSAASGTVVFSPGEQERRVPIRIRNDRDGEGDQYFILEATHVVGATLPNNRGTVTIIDDEPSVSISDLVVTEGSRVAVFSVTLSSAYGANVTVKYKTVAGSARSGSRNDYISKSGTLRFSPGQISKSVSISIVNNSRVEGNESFQVKLSNATRSKVIKHGTATIIDDDGVSQSVVARLVSSAWLAVAPLLLVEPIAPVPEDDADIVYVDSTTAVATEIDLDEATEIGLDEAVETPGSSDLINDAFGSNLEIDPLTEG